MFDKLIRLQANKITPLQADEYIKDGLKYCSNCNTPRVKVIKYQKESLKMPCLCKCQEQRRDKNDIEFKSNQEKRELQSGIRGAKYKTMKFENSTDPLPFAHEYVNNFDEFYRDNVGLMLMGDVGTGKTFSAGCIANALIDKGVRVVMANIKYFTSGIADFNERRDYVLNQLRTAQLIIIDDIGAERNTEYMNELVYQIIDERVLSGKPLIITTNLTGEQLKNAEEIALKRTYDRLKEICHPITIKGVSKRVENGKARREQLKERFKTE